MPNLPVKFRKSPEDITFAVDYFDYIAGAGYKKFYLGGLKDSVGDKYILTNDTFSSQSENWRLRGNTATGNFEIIFNNPVTIANADATIEYSIQIDGSGTGLTVTWTIYHVKGAVATAIGSVIDASYNAAGNIQQTVKLTLTEKHFSIGDILRVVPVLAVTGGANCDVHINPSGNKTWTDSLTGGTISSAATVNIPFVVDL